MEQPGRTTIVLSKQWGFQIDPEGRGTAEGWPASGLPSPKQVTVPHTWNVGAETEDYRGLGWYEYVFQTPDLAQGARVWLQFEAAYRDSVIWINGHKAGSHSNSGYTAFRIEATPFVKAGEKNLVVVSVDNGNSETALPKGRSFDWADDGGITRNVSLIYTGEAAIDIVSIQAVPLFPQAEEHGINGKLTGAIKLHEALPGDAKTFDLELELKREGQTVWTSTQTIHYPCIDVPLPEVVLEHIQLWHFDLPHLYELSIGIAAKGVLYDQVTTVFGFREFRTEGSQFLLNGEPVRLTGVEWMPGSHPDIGMAESEEDIKRILKQLKHANAVLTRFHWQQSQQLLEWCDRYGILVQEEIPLWQQPAEPDEETMVVTRQQLYEMISRHNHHPSVIAWGVGNELDGLSSQTTAYVHEMKKYIRELDSTRLINYVSNTVHLGPSTDATGAGDVLMWNDYIGTWHGEHDMDETIQALIASHPDKPIVVAEFGLCEPAFSGGDPFRQEQMVEKMAYYRNYSNIAGMIYFSFNDYRTQMGEEGEGRLRQRVHGVTDLFGNEKKSFRLLQEVSAPIQLEMINPSSGDGAVIFRLSCRNDLPSYSVRGYKLHLKTEDGDWGQIVNIPDLAPGEQTDISIPTTAISRKLKAVIQRPTGFVVLEQAI
ncbi:glycoside hydrolase family 2 protein [Paenibacillus sp. CAU 1782]